MNRHAEWDGEQGSFRGKLSPAYESASLIFLVQLIISLECAAEAESIILCLA